MKQDRTVTMPMAVSSEHLNHRIWVTHGTENLWATMLIKHRKSSSPGQGVPFVRIRRTSEQFQYNGLKVTERNL